MKKIFDFLFSRMTIIIIGFLAQLFILIWVLRWFRGYFEYFYILNLTLTILSVLYVVNSNINPSYKIIWIICINSIPVLGLAIFLLFSGNRLSRIEKKRLYKSIGKQKYYLKSSNELLEEIKANDMNIGNQLDYIKNYALFPIYKNTSYEYYKIGEDFYDSLLRELKKAEKFIFIEYFIISKGNMWDNILEILKEKAKQGVEIRIVYDDLGCFFTLPKNYKAELENYGIKCAVFNKINPIFSIIYNNRDHRKIAVIDGKTAFTGGINLADEYINKIVRFGHWKDTAVMLKGEAVWSFTVMFLSLWDFTCKTTTNFNDYKINCPSVNSKGYCVPFTDNPFTRETLSEIIYLNLISSATNYVYIMTPYLILDNELITALTNAAKRGVKVEIITPHIPDKKAVFSVTQANYRPLVSSGIKIYEYTPGFVHAKGIVVDDKVAIVGSINLDFRSLYLHFECGTLFYDCDIINDIKEDFINTKNISQEITKKYLKDVKLYKRLYQSVLKVFSPLM